MIGDEQSHRVIVDNRGGAGGTIGVASTLQVAADGATIVAGGVHQPMAEALYPKRGYRIDVDFVPVQLMVLARPSRWKAAGLLWDGLAGAFRPGGCGTARPRAAK